MNERGIKWFLWLMFWPVLIPMLLFKWFFPMTEEEKKKHDVWHEGLRESERDSLLFGETHRKY